MRCRSTSSASRRLRVKAFSTSTGFPARRASRACSWCSLCGLATYTASTSGSATRSAYDPCARSTPCRPAKSWARSIEREPTATTRERVPSCTASAKMLAMPPGPSTPQRIGRRLHRVGDGGGGEREGRGRHTTQRRPSAPLRTGSWPRPRGRRRARRGRRRAPCAANQVAIVVASRSRNSKPCGLPMTSTICGQSMMHEALVVQQHVVGREVTVRPAVVRQGEHRRAQLLEQLGEQVGLGPGRHQPRGRDRGVAGEVADERHQHLALVELHGVGHREVELPEPPEGVELGGRPLAGDHLLAEVGAPGHRPHLAALAHAAPLEVAGVAVEEPVVAVAVALGGHRADPVGARHPAPQHVDVGLLAGLEHAEVALDGAEVGDHPVGAGLRAVRRAVPGGPAVPVGRCVR